MAHTMVVEGVWTTNDPCSNCNHNQIILTHELARDLKARCPKCGEVRNLPMDCRYVAQ